MNKKIMITADFSFFSYVEALPASCVLMNNHFLSRLPFAPFLCPLVSVRCNLVHSVTSPSADLHHSDHTDFSTPGKNVYYKKKPQYISWVFSDDNKHLIHTCEDLCGDKELLPVSFIFHF